jgi:eukaryotic-like serine/threonine-protein kinase
MTLPAGTHLGRYEIRSLLGAGGMGEVYLAQDTRLGRKVALKLLTAEFMKNEDRLRRFEQEACAASALNHPSILTIYEVGEDTGLHFIATEFIDGCTLRERMARQERMSLSEALDVAVQIASALAAAHAAEIVHRDIKPENIMLRKDALVKVVDFGLAKLAEKSEQPAIASEVPTRALGKTHPGTMMGTVGYMSPEQARGLEVDARTDLWSLGVILYEIVAGRTPFLGATATDIIVSIAEREPPLLASYQTAVPPELERIVKKALRKDREERYQTAKDFALDLKNLRRELEIEVELSRSVQPTASTGGSATRGSRAATVETANETLVPTRELGVAHTTAAPGGNPSSAEYLVTEIKQPRKATAVALVAILIAVASIAYFYFTRSGKAIDSVAVLPFSNSSTGPDSEYLSDGIAESIINSLSQLPDLKVISRSSAFRYKGKETDLQTIGRELGVQAVLAGRLVQRGDNMIISTELVDVRDNRHIWGERYDRKLSDLLSVQRELAKEISEKLRSRLSGDEQERVTRSYTTNTEAYQLYVRGRHHWDKRTAEGFKRAIEYFQQAVDKDPAYGLAYAGLADCYALLSEYDVLPPGEAYPKARAAAARALKIDDTLAEAHTTLAYCKYSYDWDFAGGEREFKRAIELNANYATGHQWYAEFLTATGRFDEALAEANKAQQLDPLSLIIDNNVGDVYMAARQYDQALEQYRKTLEMNVNFARAYLPFSDALLCKGKHEEAVAAWLKWMELSGESAEAVALKAAFRKAGMRGFWRKEIELRKEQAKRRYVSPIWAARSYALLGEKDQAFEWLEQAYRERDNWLVMLKVFPWWDGLRSDPRFTDLVRRVGLPP